MINVNISGVNWMEIEDWRFIWFNFSKDFKSFGVWKKEWNQFNGQLVKKLWTYCRGEHYGGLENKDSTFVFTIYQLVLHFEQAT